MLPLPLGLACLKKGGASPSFTPNSLPNLATWHDASDAATITSSGGSVSQWSDKSTNANHLTQGTAVSQPKTALNTIGGLNAITSDGSNDFMTFTSSISRTNGYSIFFVVQATDSASVKGLISGVGVASPSVEFTATEQVSIIQISSSTLLTGASSGLTSPIILYTRSTATGEAIWLNGVSDGSNATAPSYASDITQIFRRSSSLNFLGYLGELIICLGDVTQANANLTGNYLANKWGISWTNI